MNKQDVLKEYFQHIGSRGGRKSRRKLSSGHARRMVAVREVF